MTAEEAAEIIKSAIKKVIPESEVICVPLADGGEGTVKALTAANGGRLISKSVSDPLGRRVEAQFGIAGDTAFLEMAAASGMVLLTPEERDPMLTSTYGTGEMILEALSHGADHIIIGIGGSATNDGGTGMAEALGYRFFDRDGNQLSGLCGGMLKQIARIDGSKADERIKNCRFTIASDVNNPLLGTNGCVAVFSGQKGATSEMKAELEAGLENLLCILRKQKFITSDVPGDGAAGGLGLGLRAFCNAVPESGARLAIAATGLEEKMQNADYLITGEGCSDDQTGNGKLCSEVQKSCERCHVKCIMLSGKVIGDNFPGFHLVRATVAAETPFEEIKPHTRELLFLAAEKLAAELK